MAYVKYIYIPRFETHRLCPPDTVGSCSMLPREKQGVVDPKLKVSGYDCIFWLVNKF